MSLLDRLSHTKGLREFRRQVTALKTKLDTLPNFIAIDPASTNLGYAIVMDGVITSSGVITAPSRKAAHLRLIMIYEELKAKEDFNVLVVEQLRGSVHKVLNWSVGAIITAVQPEHMLEVPYEVWQAFRPDDYEKTDELDARLMAEAMIEAWRIF